MCCGGSIFCVCVRFSQKLYAYSWTCIWILIYGSRERKMCSFHLQWMKCIQNFMFCVRKYYRNFLGPKLVKRAHCIDGDSGLKWAQHFGLATCYITGHLIHGKRTEIKGMNWINNKNVYRIPSESIMFPFSISFSLSFTKFIYRTQTRSCSTLLQFVELGTEHITESTYNIHTVMKNFG